MALVSMGLAWFHWGLSLVGCAMFCSARRSGRAEVDYRLLVCGGLLRDGHYLARWLVGVGAPARSTPGHFLEGTIGLIPSRATIFSPFNLASTALVVTGRRSRGCCIRRRAIRGLVDPGRPAPLLRLEPPPAPTRWTLAARIVSRAMAHARHGRVRVMTGSPQRPDRRCVPVDARRPELHTFLDARDSAASFGGVSSILSAAERGAALARGYRPPVSVDAGMYGVIQGTGLARMLGNAIASAATPSTLPLSAGPRDRPRELLRAVGRVEMGDGSARTWSMRRVVSASPCRRWCLAYAWGDMATDIIQPFWALPTARGGADRLPRHPGLRNPRASWLTLLCFVCGFWLAAAPLTGWGALKALAHACRLRSPKIHVLSVAAPSVDADVVVPVAEDHAPAAAGGRVRRGRRAGSGRGARARGVHAPRIGLVRRADSTASGWLASRMVFMVAATGARDRTRAVAPDGVKRGGRRGSSAAGASHGSTSSPARWTAHRADILAKA